MPVPSSVPSERHAVTPRAQHDYRKEIRITRLTLAFIIIAWITVSWETGGIFIDRVQSGNIAASIEQAIFIFIVQGLIYGSFIYQLTRLGYCHRRLNHYPTPTELREKAHATHPRKLTILVPSYKEELAVIEYTLLSAALQDFADRRVVLLLDDPYSPTDLASKRALDNARRLPIRLQAIFDSAAEPFIDANNAFLSRLDQGPIDRPDETRKIISLYEQAADWLLRYASAQNPSDERDRLVIDQVLLRAAAAHQQSATKLTEGRALDKARIKREYQRLARLFKVELTSFERKRYVNLSHEPNKAMNLNSYIGLLGRSLQEVRRSDGIHLVDAVAGASAIKVPAADFLITLDADSILVPEYASLLMYQLLLPCNQRVAVIQTPYNTIPSSIGVLERIAGATTDIQYLIHQGFTHYDATYWVGANAMLRVAALPDIRQRVQERGFEIDVFVQDRTVIEDTESSIDLIACGWRLYNYPDRLAFSATPPDFGSLLIQRARWANGGLIIMPKLLRYLLSAPWRVGKIAEGFFRLHYLGSIAVVNIGLLILLGHSFENSTHGIWLQLTALPYFFLYARDLQYSGYRLSDLVRIYALNLLLLPVNLAGVAKSLQQAITGRRIPFARTPKISGRVTVPMPFVLAEYALLLSWLGGLGMDLQSGRWTSAAFCFINAALLAYAIGKFVGWRASWDDICLGMPWANRTTVQAHANETASLHAPDHTPQAHRVIDMPPKVTETIQQAAVRKQKY